MQPERQRIFPVAEPIERAAEWLARSRFAVALTGAGLSTESGIPDFRSPGGLWDRYDPDDFTYQKFVADPKARRTMWRMIAEEFLTDAQPNPAHLAIAELERLGKLDCVITQNVDDLHQRAGNSPERVFELHGNMKWAICLGCGQLFSMDHIRDRLEAGEETPDCEACHGMLKPAGVLFGETLPEKVLQGAIDHSRSCDLMFVIGSTLLVYPAAYMPVYAAQAGAKVVIVNLTPTPLDKMASLIIQGRAGGVMSQIVARVREKSKIL